MKQLPEFSLSQKLLILVVLPLAVQFSLMLGLAKVQADAEKELAEVNLALEISDIVSQLNNDVCELVAAYGNDKFLTRLSADEKSFIESRDHIKGEFARLRALAHGKLDVLESLEQAEKAENQAIADLLEVKQSVLLYGPVERGDRRQIWDKFKGHFLQLMGSELFTIGKREFSLANQAPLIESRMRKVQQNMMIAFAIAGIFVTVAMVIILSKSITQRLAKMMANTYLLASGEPLLPVLRGSDDICKLDQVFHSMAGALEGARRKEGAFIDGANDVLCMIAPGGRITSINAACVERFGFSKGDLLGSRLSDLVIAADQDNARNYLDKIHSGVAQDPIELRMRRLDRSVVDTLWSAQWSKEEDSYFCIIHDITQIRDAERTKQEVVAMVTHDLKTPLTTLGNALEILLTATSEKSDHYIAMAQRNVAHMTSLVADLLDIEKARAGMMQLSKALIELSRCFDATLDTTAGMAEAKKIRVTCQATDHIVEADPEALTRVIINLVANAIKFSPPGAEVIIGAAKAPGFIHVWVQDQGQGIPAADLDRVFDRFQQASQSGGAKNAGGTGLGLTICKEFVRLHGGEIWAESSPGKGSKFTFTLPA